MEITVQPPRGLKLHRLLRGWTQQQVAEQIGLKAQNVSVLESEHGRVWPRPHTILHLAGIFGVEPEEVCSWFLERWTDKAA